MASNVGGCTAGWLSHFCVWKREDGLNKLNVVVLYSKWEETPI